MAMSSATINATPKPDIDSDQEQFIETEVISLSEVRKTRSKVKHANQPQSPKNGTQLPDGLASKDPLKAYIIEAGKEPLLSREGEVEICKRIENIQNDEQALKVLLGLNFLLNDSLLDESHTEKIQDSIKERWEARDRARNEFTKANLRLVIFIAKKFQNLGLDLMDLIQEGNIGLMKAVKRFDYKRGYRLSTYASWWIRQSIQRAIAYKGRTVRQPVHTHEARRKINRLRSELIQRLEREPTRQELAAKTGINPKKLENMLSLEGYDVSLEAPLNGGECALEDFLQDEGALTEDNLIGNADTAFVQKLLESISDRDREVLKSRFEKNMTLDEIGKVTKSSHKNTKKKGVSRERIRQIEAQALKKLRLILESKGYEYLHQVL